jgi:hypothetical protein
VHNGRIVGMLPKVDNYGKFSLETHGVNLAITKLEEIRQRMFQEKTPLTFTAKINKGILRRTEDKDLSEVEGVKLGFILKNATTEELFGSISEKHIPNMKPGFAYIETKDGQLIQVFTKSVAELNDADLNSRIEEYIDSIENENLKGLLYGEVNRFEVFFPAEKVGNKLYVDSRNIKNTEILKRDRENNKFYILLENNYKESLKNTIFALPVKVSPSMMDNQKRAKKAYKYNVDLNAPIHSTTVAIINEQEKLEATSFFNFLNQEYC